jgi:hypothetical protein
MTIRERDRLLIILLIIFFQEKSYKTEKEESHRKTVFTKNLDLVKKHNAKGNSSFTLAMNQLGDLTVEEFNAMLNGVIKPNKTKVFFKSLVTNVTKEVKWYQRLK